jgi:diguanylate cyclase (GGDEF)-like protein
LIKKFIHFLILLAPAALITLIMGMALIQGIEHVWLERIFVLSGVISLFAIVYACGLLVALHTNHDEKEKELYMNNMSFSANEQKNRQLRAEIEKLTGMREIQMSSHIDSFSDLLRNILKITHIATEARSLTIFLESRDQFGIVYPKTHMRWEPVNSKIPGEVFVFFENELMLYDNKVSQFEDFSIDLQNARNINDREIVSELSFEGEISGLIQYTPNFDKSEDVKHEEKLEQWLKEFKLSVIGAYSCWKTRSPRTDECESTTVISVPIVTQDLMIGVLSAEFVGMQRDGAFNEQLRAYQNTLIDYGRNIGQPLKKEELYEEAIKDAMTGLFNKAHYESLLNEHFHRMKRYGRDLSFIFIDIDHFKKINDNYGHLTGDIALKYVSRLIMENIRQSDMAFRIGGEELCVLLVETGIEMSISVAEKLRSIIEQTEFPKEGGGHIRFTASFGVAVIDSDMKEPHDLTSAADKAVYNAKETGRNKVVSWDEIKNEISSTSST